MLITAEIKDLGPMFNRESFLCRSRVLCDWVFEADLHFWIRMLNIGKQHQSKHVNFPTLGTLLNLSVFSSGSFSIDKMNFNST